MAKTVGVDPLVDGTSGTSVVGQRHIPGEAGVWVLLFGDMMIFAVLFTVFLHQRALEPELFASSQESLNRALGAANTLVLLTSSLLIVFAAHAVHCERWRPYANRLTFAGVGIGMCFVVIKAFEYHEKIAAGITPGTNDFFMYYFVLTGLHLLHVIIGLVVLTVLSGVARKPNPTRTQLAFFEGGGCFWHMVDLLWLVIFPLVFLVR